jgi:uncharacterized protein
MMELAEVLQRAKFRAILKASNTDIHEMLRQVGQLIELIDPPPLNQPVSRDSDDDIVLALAVAGGADFVVSGDRDLLSLASYSGIPIIDATEAIARVRQE